MGKICPWWGSQGSNADAFQQMILNHVISHGLRLTIQQAENTPQASEEVKCLQCLQ